MSVVSNAARYAQAPLIFALTTLMFCWPLAYNRDAILFSDTVPYLTAGREVWAGLGNLTHVHAAKAATKAASVSESGASPDAHVHRAISGRSPYYGAFAWQSRRFGGIVGVGVAQAAWLALVVLAAFPTLGITTWPRQLAAAGTLAATTSLPFFVATVMPDAFAGVGALSIGLLWCFGREMSRGRQIFWLFNLLAATLFHMSFLLASASLLFLLLVWSLFQKRAQAVGHSGDWCNAACRDRRHPRDRHAYAEIYRR